MHERISPAKSNEEVTEQVGRITEKLLARATKLGLKAGTLSLPGTVENPGTTITTNVRQESNGIRISKASETGNGSDVHSVEVPANNGNIKHGHGFKVAAEHIGWTSNALDPRPEPTVMSKQVVEAARESGRYSPMSVRSHSGEFSRVEYNTEHRPATNQTIHETAQTLSEIRGAIADVEIKVQQPQSPAEHVDVRVA